MNTSHNKAKKAFSSVVISLLLIGIFFSYGYGFNISTSISSATQVIKSFFVTDNGSAPDGTNEVLSVNSGGNGNIGIGTSNPLQSLEITNGNIKVNAGWIQGETAGGTQILIKDSTDNQVWALHGNNDLLNIRDTIAGTNPFRIEETTPTNTLYLNASGNVGIGTSTPQEQLHVVGPNGAGAKIEIETLDTNNPALKLTDSTKSYQIYLDNNKLHFRDVSSWVNRISITDDGKVGIWTTDPAEILEIRDTIDPAIRLRSNSTGNRIWQVKIDDTNEIVKYTSSYGSTSAYPQAWFNTTNELMRLTTDGKLGIGMTGPVKTLDVNGTFGVNSNLTNTVALFESTDPTVLINLKDDTTTGNGYAISRLGDNLRFYTNDTIRAMIDSGGNVGIGNTNPTELLDIDSDAIRIRSSQTPASSWATCNAGTIAWDSGYMYICVATNTWKRAALSTW